MRINFYDAQLDSGGRVVLVKEKGVDYKTTDGKADSPAMIALMMHQILRLDEKAEEHIYMLALNSACRILGIFFISKGIVNASIASPREIYMRALLTGAAQIVLVHNHPSGFLCPSEADISLTERVKQAGGIINIPLADHIIIGGGRKNAYISFREENIL